MTMHRALYLAGFGYLAICGGVAGEAGGDTISELARDLDAEGRRQVEAAREVAELLA